MLRIITGYMLKNRSFAWILFAKESGAAAWLSDLASGTELSLQQKGWYEPGANSLPFLVSRAGSKRGQRRVGDSRPFSIPA